MSNADRELDLFTFLGVMVLMAVLVGLYEWLVPFQLRLSPGWEEPAFLATTYLIFMLLIFRGLRRKISFWFALAISLSVHLYIAHGFVSYRATHPSGPIRSTAQLTFVIALLVWLLVFSACSFLSRRLVHSSDSSQQNLQR